MRTVRPPLPTGLRWSIRRNRNASQAREDAAGGADGGTEGNPEASDPPNNDGGTTSSGGSDYRRAILIPGKEGFVFNPFTNNPVDVRGIPSGTLVRDPQDPNTEHKFRVP